MTYLKRFLRLVFVLVAISGVLAGAIVIVAPQARTVIASHHSDHEQLTLKPLAQRSYIYDSKGNEQGVMTNRENPQNRVTVTLDQIPEPVVESILAVEDANFYEHKGVNIRSIARAVDANLESGGVSQGGSTITQQVVKNALVGDKQDFSRKLREAFLAVELEKQMTKEEILEYYLNSVYFGGGAYGVQAAAELYYAKDVSELDWAEGAMLAALIASPNEHNPVNHPDKAAKQRTLAFRRLVETGKLTQVEADFADAFPLPTTTVRPSPPYDYFVDAVQEELLHDPKYNLGSTETERNRNVYEGGIKVFTTFDPDLQAKAEQARDETLPDTNGDGTFTVTNSVTGQPEMGTQAIASVEPSSGAVRVMVGGPGFDRLQLNLTMRGRPVGSTMKTFVAATLFEQGYTPSSTLSGSCTFKWANEEKGTPTTTYAGKLGSIKSMIVASSNCGFIGLGQAAGLENVADLAERVGVRSSLYTFDKEGQPLPLPPSLPLGTENITPLEMASAYATFANDGVYNEPYLIERIEDSNGRVIYQHRSEPRQVVDQTTARLVTEVLEANVVSGTGKRARIASGQPAAGKTGTTDAATDLWFVGYTPQLSTAVWMGAPRLGTIALESRFRGAFGGTYPAATWGAFYAKALDGHPIVEFLEPVDIPRTKYIPRPDTMSGGSRSRSSGSTTTRRTTPSTPSTTQPQTTTDDDAGTGGGTGGGGGGGNDDDPGNTGGGGGGDDTGGGGGDDG